MDLATPVHVRCVVCRKDVRNVGTVGDGVALPAGWRLMPFRVENGHIVPDADAEPTAKVPVCDDCIGGIQ